MSRAARLRIVFGLLLCATTLAFFAWDGRFRVDAPSVLADREMQDGFRNWSGTAGFVGYDADEGGAVALLAGGPTNLTFLSQTIDRPGRFDRYRVTLDMKVEGIVPRAIAWQRAGVVLRPFDARGQRFRYWPYVVAEAAGTAGWHRIDKIMAVPPDAARLLFAVYNAGSAGTLWVRDINVAGLTETPLGAGLRHALMVAWAGLVLSSALAVLRAGRPVLRWGLLGLGAFILAGTLAPEPGLSALAVDVGRQAQRLVDAGADLLPAPAPARPGAPTGPPAAASDADSVGKNEARAVPQDAPPAAAAPSDADAPLADSEPAGAPPVAAPSPEARRTLLAWVDAVVYDGRPILGMGLGSFAHLCAYFAFAFVSVLALRGVGVPWLAGALLLSATATEVLQSFSPTRGVEAGDVAFNAIGIAVGLAFGLLARRVLGGLRPSRRAPPSASA